MNTKIKQVLKEVFSKVLTEDSKDEQRLQDIKIKANGKKGLEQQLAERMANAIKDPAKAFSRGELALEVFPQNFHISRIFIKRAAELGHPEAKLALGKVAEDEDRKSKELHRVRQEQSKQKALKFQSAFNKRYPMFETSITTSTPVQYQHNYKDNTYVLIQGDISKLTKGLSGLGDRQESNVFNASGYQYISK